MDGPIRPKNNEDSHYDKLRDEQWCADATDLGDVGAWSSERNRPLFEAGAYACLGELEQAAAKFQEFEASPLAWAPDVSFGEYQVTIDQVCGVHEAVLRYLNRPPEPCGFRLATTVVPYPDEDPLPTPQPTEPTG